MEQIRIPNISQYSVKVINGELIITPKDPMNPHIQRYKKEIPRRKPSPKTPDPNKRVEKHEEFEDESDVIVLRCGHIFLLDPLQQWIGIQKICPTCKQGI